MGVCSKTHLNRADTFTRRENVSRQVVDSSMALITHSQTDQYLTFTNDILTLKVARQVGPRVTHLYFGDSPNLFAELPGESLPHPKGGSFHFYGGHRLWYAPEKPSITYLPDNAPVKICQKEKGVLLMQPVELETGIQKSMELELDQATVEVTHTIKNTGNAARELAPWAITQMAPGGTAILPQQGKPIEKGAVLPNRQLALWSYTDINSPCIRWGNAYSMIDARMTEGMLKVGYANHRGWLAYWLAGILFVKQAPFNRNGKYFDLGSSSEVFCKDTFLELETLGEIVNLQPDESITHTETWHVYGDVPQPKTEQDVAAFVEELELT